MSKLQRHGLPLAFVLTFIVVGVPYWLIPYNKINLPDALLTPSLLVACLTALILRSYAGPKFWRVALTIAAAVPAAVLVRVIVDCAHDSTAHNLWPFEIVIASFVGFASALPGAIIGTLIRFARGKLSGA